MAHKEFDFAGTEEYGESAPGFPRGPITDDWIAERALADGVPADEIRAAIASLKRADGKPLYPPTRYGKDELADAPAPKPKVPLGERPAG